MARSRVLVIDDEPDIRTLLKEILEDEGYQISLAADAAAARAALMHEMPDVALLDIWMPGEDGIALLRDWTSNGALTFPVVMMSGHGTIDTAIGAIKLGAYDFIEKPIALGKLLVTLQRALEANELRRANAALRRHLQVTSPIGQSPPMRALFGQLQRVAAHDTPVLLRGEPGTGKETLARWLHDLSGRGETPFVIVAAGAIASEQAAATLFGTEGDGGIRAGLLEQAQGGTLFLDEVAELSAELQMRLSTVIERRQLLRLGGRQPVALDVRIVAASAQDLEAARAAGRFRDELYFQLNVVPVLVPPLRERREDLPLLIGQLVEFFHRRDHLPPRIFPSAVLQRLSQYPWPGNVRELRNLVQRLLVLGQDSEVTAAELDLALRSGTSRPLADPGTNYSLPLREAREQFERHYFQYQLQQAGGSVGKLAALAGMERTHLYRKLRDLGIELKTTARDAVDG